MERGMFEEHCIQAVQPCNFNGRDGTHAVLKGEHPGARMSEEVKCYIIIIYIYTHIYIPRTQLSHFFAGLTFHFMGSRYL